MTRKKIVFVIVEGPSDDEALEILLEKLFENNKVFVHITHGDITSEPGIDPAKILAKVGEMVKWYAKSNHLTSLHFQRIIHIVDMDGAYIPDQSIVEDISAEKPIYSLTEIRTANVNGIKQRNDTKRLCLNHLSIASESWGIPYQVYYMSCNLDHVLYNKQNSSNEEKEHDAIQFVKKYRNDLDGFIAYISKSCFSVQSNYIDSWNYIKQNLHSLERHTNLGLCFDGTITINP